MDPENTQGKALTEEDQNFLRAVDRDPALGMPEYDPNKKTSRPQDADDHEESSSK